MSPGNIGVGHVIQLDLKRSELTWNHDFTSVDRFKSPVTLNPVQALMHS